MPLIFGMPFCSVLMFFFLIFSSLLLLFLPSRISSRSILCIYVLVQCLHTNKDIYYSFVWLVQHIVH